MGGLVKVVEKKDVPLGSSTAVEVRGQKVAVFNVDGTFYAISDTCTHRGGPLSSGSEGEVSGTTVTCPWHGAQYDLKTRSRINPARPSRRGQLQGVVEGDNVSVEI